MAEKYIVKIILYSLFLSSFLCSAQRNDEIDVLLAKADENIGVDFNQTLKYAKAASIKAATINSSEKKAQAYYYIARSYVFYRIFDKANIYIEKGFEEEALEKNFFLNALFLDLKASYYSRMPLPESAFKTNLSTLDVLKSKSDYESLLLSAKTNMNIADYYTEISNYKTAHFYADQSINIVEKISEKKYFSCKKSVRCKANIYFYKSWIYIQEKKSQNAYPFIKKAYDQALLEKQEYLAPFLEIYGDYYFLLKDYPKAIDYYIKTVENKKRFHQFSAFVDSKISKAYKALGNTKEEMYYLAKAEKRHKLDLKGNTDNVQKELVRIVAKNNTKEKIEVRKKRITSVVIIIFFVIIFNVLFMVVRKNKKIKKQELRLLQNKEKIKNSEEEITILQEKINESFLVLIELAKKNSPHFWTRFQETYPLFTGDLLKYNPYLKVSELTLCAYIYLGFSSKEIAEMSFKAYKTIENNRRNIRKRLMIDSNIDMSIWLQENIQMDSSADKK